MSDSDVVVKATTDLTDAQELLVAVLIIPTAILSICGSALIIRDVSKRRKKAGCDRILLCLSAYDIVFSLTCIAQKWLRPPDYNNRITAFGNHGTCQALGFFTQVSSSNYYYSGMLAFYCK